MSAAHSNSANIYLADIGNFHTFLLIHYPLFEDQRDAKVLAPWNNNPAIPSLKFTLFSQTSFEAHHRDKDGNFAKGRGNPSPSSLFPHHSAPCTPCSRCPNSLKFPVCCAVSFYLSLFPLLIFPPCHLIVHPSKFTQLLL